MINGEIYQSAKREKSPTNWSSYTGIFAGSRVCLSSREIWIYVVDEYGAIPVGLQTWQVPDHTLVHPGYRVYRDKTFIRHPNSTHYFLRCSHSADQHRLIRGGCARRVSISADLCGITYSFLLCIMTEFGAFNHRSIYLHQLVRPGLCGEIQSMRRTSAQNTRTSSKTSRRCWCATLLRRDL